MRFALLSFDVQIDDALTEYLPSSRRPHEPVPTTVPLARVALLLNDHRAARAFVLDSAVLLAQRDIPGPLHPFVCECGKRECVGVEEPLQLQATPGLVTWAFPERPFRAQLELALFSPSLPLVVAFEREQYLLALGKLMDELVRAERQQGVPLSLAPHARLETELLTARLAALSLLARARSEGG